MRQCGRWRAPIVLSPRQRFTRHVVDHEGQDGGGDPILIAKMNSVVTRRRIVEDGGSSAHLDVSRASRQNFAVRAWPFFS